MARAVGDVEKALKIVEKALSFGSCAWWQIGIAWPRPSRTELTKRFMLNERGDPPPRPGDPPETSHIFKNLSRICLCQQRFAWSKFAYGSKKIEACPPPK